MCLPVRHPWVHAKLLLDLFHDHLVLALHTGVSFNALEMRDTTVLKDGYAKAVGLCRASEQADEVL